MTYPPTNPPPPPPPAPTQKANNPTTDRAMLRIDERTRASGRIGIIHLTRSMITISRTARKIRTREMRGLVHPQPRDDRQVRTHMSACPRSKRGAVVDLRR
jgi:hypothetical protein